jgi:hypothetical protein
MRTERSIRRSRCYTTFPQLRDSDTATITASDRTWRRFAAPVSLPESDMARRALWAALELYARPGGGSTFISAMPEVLARFTMTIKNQTRTVRLVTTGVIAGLANPAAVPPTGQYQIAAASTAPR